MRKLFRAMREFYVPRRFDTHNRIEVSSSALKHNLQLFHQLNDFNVIAVLKGNAYGHGIELVATILSKQPPKWLTHLAVDSYAEAIRIRQVSKLPVLIMGKIKPVNFKVLHSKDFSFVVSDAATLKALREKSSKASIHIEVNSGMNRYGLRIDELADFIKLVKTCPKIKVEGVMTHLADADGDSQATIESAVQLFERALEQIEKTCGPIKFKHIAQSAGSTRLTSGRANTIRLGIGLYGVSPLPPKHPASKKITGLQPALRVISTITAIQSVPKGEGVSYNYTFKTKRPSRIATIPFGYYEGLPRELSNCGHAYLMASRQAVPITGRVCMNHTMLDVTGLGSRVGDEVLVLGGLANDPTSIEVLSNKQGFFAYSLLTGLNQTTRRQII